MYKVVRFVTSPTTDDKGGQEHLMVSRNRKSGTQMLMIPCYHSSTIVLGKDLSWEAAKKLRLENKTSEIMNQNNKYQTEIE